MTDAGANEFSDTEVVDVDQILTSRGQKTDGDVTPGKWVIGALALEEWGTFFGRDSMLEDIGRLLKQNGIVVIEGCKRSGKTSLAKTYAQRDGKEVFVSFTRGSLPAMFEKYEKFIGREVPDRDKVYVVDEIEAMIRFANPPTTPEEIKQQITGLINKGSKVIISVNGDLTSPSYTLSTEFKLALLELAGDSVVINKLMTDDEMRELLSRGGEPIFTEEYSKWLVKQAGGDPKLGAFLASESVAYFKNSKGEPSKLLDSVKSSAILIMDEPVFDYKWAVNQIIKAGYDPVTLEYTGEDPEPNKEYYKNLIPRNTSTIFREWLSSYVEEKGQKQGKDNTAQ